MNTDAVSSPRCAVCGTPCRPPFRAPPPELAPDLDLRPGEPTRSTLPRWVQTCRTCGASAPDLASLPEGAAGVVQTAGYRALAATAPGAAAPLLRWAAIRLDAGDHAGAAEAMLQAAWAADDADDPERARAWRLEAARLWGEPAPEETSLRVIDALRRAGAFDAAAMRAASLLGSAQDENTRRIAAFQQTRIAARDPGRHLMSSALRPPARMPHVAHTGKRPPSGGFWSRLIGR